MKRFIKDYQIAFIFSLAMGIIGVFFNTNGQWWTPLATMTTGFVMMASILKIIYVLRAKI